MKNRCMKPEWNVDRCRHPGGVPVKTVGKSSVHWEEFSLLGHCFNKYCSLHSNEWLCNCMLQHVTRQQGDFLLIEMIYFGVACYRLVVRVVQQQN